MKEVIFLQLYFLWNSKVWCFTQESVLDFLRNGNHQVIISILPSLFARMDQLSTQQQIGLLFCVPCFRELILEQRYYGAQCHETQRKRENIRPLESLCDEDLWEGRCRVAFWELVVCRTLALQTYWTFEI